MIDTKTEYSQKYDDYSTDEYPPDWEARRKKVLERDGYVCQSCGVKSTRVDDVRFDVDHIVPKSENGSHALENLQTLCPSCHANKHPDIDNLQQRAHAYERRNKPGVWGILRVLLVVPILLDLLQADSDADDQETVEDDHGRQLNVIPLRDAIELPEETGVTVDISPTSIWRSQSDAVHQMGELTDASADGPTVRFVAWAGYDLPTMNEHNDYRLIGAKTNSYQGEFQLVLDSQTSIQPL